MAFSWGNYDALKGGGVTPGGEVDRSGRVFAGSSPASSTPPPLSALGRAGDGCGETESLPHRVTLTGVSAPAPSNALNETASECLAESGDLGGDALPTRGTKAVSLSALSEGGQARGQAVTGFRRPAPPSLSASDRAPIPQEPHGVTGALNLLAHPHAVGWTP